MILMYRALVTCDHPDCTAQEAYNGSTAISLESFEKDAHEVFRRSGWRMTHNLRYLCPTCAKATKSDAK